MAQKAQLQISERAAGTRAVCCEDSCATITVTPERSKQAPTKVRGFIWTLLAGAAIFITPLVTFVLFITAYDNGRKSADQTSNYSERWVLSTETYAEP